MELQKLLHVFLFLDEVPGFGFCRQNGIRLSPAACHFVGKMLPRGHFPVFLDGLPGFVVYICDFSFVLCREGHGERHNAQPVNLFNAQVQAVDFDFVAHRSGAPERI